MIEAQTPTLWELRLQLGHPAAVAILVNAFIHAAKLVNLDKNLSTEQIGEAAIDTLELHGQLKVEEVKYLLKRALRTQNVYGRLDYNVIMNWVEQYDAERTEEAMRLSDEEAARQQNKSEISPETISFEEYVADLKQRSATDKDAAERLEQIEAMTSQPTIMQTEQKERDFQVFKLNYLFGKKK